MAGRVTCSVTKGAQYNIGYVYVPRGGTSSVCDIVRYRCDAPLRFCGIPASSGVT